MPDHRIGISVDVRNGGTDKLKQDFEGVAKSADSIKGRFADLDRATSGLLRRGWGSQQYTQELRNQLRMLEQMTNLIERRAGRAGNLDVQREMQGIGKQIGGAARDVGAVRGISMPSSGDIARSIGSAAGEALGAYLGTKAATLLYQGYQANIQMLPAFANMGKTMAPGGGNMAWTQSMLRAGQGFGYTNPEILAGAQTIQGAAGQTPDFFNQIRGVAQFGRMNGFDYGQAAGYFSGSYRAGITGGTGAQMSWQEYAILVANTVQAGSMQGRNAQVVESLQQLTQIAQQTMLNAPDQRQVGALYATATRTGNQALINQYPSIMAGINAGIQSPGWGAYGQAAMWQAVAPKANYWHAQYIESQGAFGTGDNGKTNFQNVMTYAYNRFGGNTEQAAVMVGQWLNVSPVQAKVMMSTYIPKGTFNTTAFSANQAALQKQLQPSPLQQAQQNFVNPLQATQGWTSRLTGIGSTLTNLAFGNPLGMGASFGVGLAASNALLKRIGLGGFGKSLPQLGKFFRGGGSGAAMAEGADLAGAGAADVAGAGAADIGVGVAGGAGRGILGKIGGTLSKYGKFGKIGGPALAAAFELPETINDIRGGQAGKGIGGLVGTAGGTWGGAELGAMIGTAVFPGAGTIIGGLVGAIGGAIAGKYGGEALGGAIQGSNNRQGVTYAQFNASLEAEHTAAILMALRPWAKQIEGWYGADGTSGGNAGGTKNANLSFVPRAGLDSAPITGGDWLSKELGGVNSPLGRWAAGATGRPYTGVTPTSTLAAPAGAQGFVKNMRGYAQEASKATGLPVNFLLAQWGNESAWGSSDLATKNNNFGGIKDSRTGDYMSYASPEAFAQGDISFYTQNSRYAKLLADAKAGVSERGLAADLQASGYAENSSYGKDIVDNFLPVVNSALGQQPQGGGGPGKVEVSAPKQVQVVVKDSSGKKVGSTMIDLTTRATMNGLESGVNKVEAWAKRVGMWGNPFS